MQFSRRNVDNKSRLVVNSVIVSECDNRKRWWDLFPHFSNYSTILYSGPCCPWSITLDASADVIKMFPQYFGRYNPTGKIYHRAPVYINKNGLFLFVNKKGAWSANDKVNDRGLLRGTGTGNDGNCVASVTNLALWDKHDWRSANIRVSCIQGTRDSAYMTSTQSMYLSVQPYICFHLKIFRLVLGTRFHTRRRL